MTPGPEPREAIRQAITNAAARGKVMDRDLINVARIPFILFCAGLTVFVLVKRTRVHITSPEDCAAEYWRDILRLRRVPLNGVVARELWLLNPWGTWQYFRILDDRVIEIRADGMPMVTERAAFTKGPAPVTVPVPDSSLTPVPDPAPAPIPDPSSDPSPTPVPDPEPDSGTDSVPASEPALIPDPVPVPEPDRVSLPELSPVESSPSSDEGE